jgi:TolB protein
MTMRFPVICLVIILLTACASSAPNTTPAPVLLPATIPLPEPGAPQPTLVAASVRLPGRLLFVRDGTIWMWQDQTGRPLIVGNQAVQPVWAPDGSAIAYIQRDQSSSDLMIAPLDGGKPLRLTNNGSRHPHGSFERIFESVWAFYPSFAPDGQTIAYASQYAPPSGSLAAEYHLALFTIPAQPGGARRLIYADDAGHVGRVTHTPNGLAIVFTLEPAYAGGLSQIMRYDRTTGTVAPQPDVPRGSYDPAFSPDGRWLVFAGRDGDRTDIFAVPVAGGTIVRLTGLGTARAPAFSPDGGRIAFLAVAPGETGFDLWVADIRTLGDSIQASSPRQVSIGLRADADSGLSWGK